MKVFDLGLNCSFILFNVYGPIKIEEKALVWSLILEFMRMFPKERIIAGGDFNAILDLSEKRGGVISISQTI